jgi:hypothetical protein
LVCCTVLATFGLWRADQKNHMVMECALANGDDFASCGEIRPSAAVTEVTVLRPILMALHDDRLWSSSCPKPGGRLLMIHQIPGTDIERLYL